MFFKAWLFEEYAMRISMLGKFFPLKETTHGPQMQLYQNLTVAGPCCYR